MKQEIVEEKAPTQFGRMKGTVKILGDIVGPAGVIWEADSDNPDLSLYAGLGLLPGEPRPVKPRTKLRKASGLPRRRPGR